MGSFNTKRVSITAVVLVAVTAAVAGGKLLYDINIVNAPMAAEVRLLEERRDAATKAGLPIKPQDMDTRERVHGFALHSEFVKFQEYLADRPNLIGLLENESQAERAAQLLADDEAHINALLAASRLGNVNTPIDWEGGLGAKDPVYVSYNQYVRVACAIASYHFRQGDTDSALAFVNASADLAAQLTDEPSLHAVSSWVSCSSRVIRTAFQFVEESPNDHKLVAGIAAALEKVSPPRDLKHIVRGESLRFVMTARNWERMTREEKLDLQLQRDESRIEPPTGNLVAEAIESKSLWFWAEAMKSATAEEANLFDVGVKIDDIGRIWLINEDEPGYLARSFAMTFEQTAMGIIRVAQLRNLAMTATEIIGQWQSTSALPDHLAGDKPSHRDPLTGQPLHYVKNGKGFVLQVLGDQKAEDARPPVADLRLVPGQGPGLTFTLG